MDQNAELRERLTEQYRKGNIVFVPFGSLPKTNGLFIPVAERVFIGPDDFYKVQKKFGLSHFGFMKLASAAGVQWVPAGQNVGRMDNMSNKDYCSFRVVGKIRTTEGLWHEVSASKHLDLDAKQIGIEMNHANSYDFKTNKGQNVWPKNKDEYVKKLTMRDLAQLRDNIDERCESGAQSRVVKLLMHIPANFPTNNPREFHVVKYILDPSDPNVKQAQLACFTQAMSGIYGPAGVPQLNQPEPIKNITPKAEDITQKPESFTPKAKNETLDSSLIDFENLENHEKAKTIRELIGQTGYSNLLDDESNVKAQLENWSGDQMTEYFIHIKKETSQQ